MKATKSMIEREIKAWLHNLSKWASIAAGLKELKDIDATIEFLEHKLNTLKFLAKEWKEAGDLWESKK